MGVSNGRFNKVTGNFTWDGAKPEASTIDVKIESDSIDSNNKGRDTHLKGPDFFNVKEYPEISFTAKNLAKTGADWTLTGDLTLLGKSNSAMRRSSSPPARRMPAASSATAPASRPTSRSSASTSG